MVSHVKERQQRVTMHFVVAHLVSKHCMLQNILSTHFLHRCYPEQEALPEIGILWVFKTDRNMQKLCIYCLFLETREKEIKS